MRRQDEEAYLAVEVGGLALEAGDVGADDLEELLVGLGLEEVPVLLEVGLEALAAVPGLDQTLQRQVLAVQLLVGRVVAAREIELRNYDRLFTLADMSQVPEDKDYKDFLNPESLTPGRGLAEPALLDDASGIAVQFERSGYYVKDRDSTAEKAVFNKTVSLKDSYKPE